MPHTGASPALRTVQVGDVELHYLERGAGAPLVFVHGGGHDLHHWDAQIAPFAERFRVVAYSRRYARPNHNAPIAPDYSARTDAADLAGLIDALGIGPVHLVAHSIGAVAALFVAVERPELVRTLVLAEPPILRWARELPDGSDGADGEALWQDFMARMWEPAGAAFRAGDPAGAMGVITDYFVGRDVWRRLPERTRARVMRNARDWEAFTTSSVAFAPLERERVRAVRVPALLLGADRTVAIHRAVDDELARLLPQAERVRIADATHDMWADQPEACRTAALGFLARHPAD